MPSVLAYPLRLQLPKQFSMIQHQLISGFLILCQMVLSHCVCDGLAETPGRLFPRILSRPMTVFCTSRVSDDAS